MAYTKVGWQNGITPENATTLGQMDQGIKDAHDLIDAMSTIEYENAWAAGVAYQPGDVVIHNGIEYMAVNPSTGSAPPTAAPPGGGGIPPTILDAKGDLIAASAADTPVRVPAVADGYALTTDAASAAGVKWAVLGDAALPQRIKSQVQLSTGLTNPNLGIQSGWFYVPNGMPNAPTGLTDYYLEVIGFSDTFTVQIAHAFYTERQFRRIQNSGTWTSWVLTFPSFTQLTAAQYAALGGSVNPNILYIIIG